MHLSDVVLTVSLHAMCNAVTQAAGFAGSLMLHGCCGLHTRLCNLGIASRYVSCGHA